MNDVMKGALERIADGVENPEGAARLALDRIMEHRAKVECITDSTASWYEVSVNLFGIQTRTGEIDDRETAEEIAERLNRCLAVHGLVYVDVESLREDED